MVLTMSSEEFKHFLELETDENIMECQYCIISTRIRLGRRGKSVFNNCCNLSEYLYPNATSIRYLYEDAFDDVYTDQLENNSELIANIIAISEKKNKTIIFIYTKSEDKLHYMTVFKNYLWEKFKLPVYSYSEFLTLPKKKFKKYDKDKVIKKIDKVRKVGMKKRLTTAGSSLIDDDRKLSDEFQTMSKQDLKALCKDEGVYTKGMSRHDMITILSSLF